MKTFFSGYGEREVKSWKCPCGNFSCGGMDLFVDKSIAEHREKCRVGISPRVEHKEIIGSSYWDVTGRMAILIEEALHRNRKIIATTITADNNRFYGSIFWTERPAGSQWIET